MIRLIALCFGGLLVLSLLVLIAYYFSPKRKTQVEEPKYIIMDDNNTQV